MTLRSLSEWRKPKVLDAILEQITEGIIIYDSTLTILAMNEAAERLLDLSADDVLQRNCRDIFGCELCLKECGIGQATHTHTPNPNLGSIHMHTAPGRERIAIIKTTKVLDEFGQVQCVIATVRGVSGERDEEHRGFVAESPALRRVLEFARRVAGSEAGTILIEGENGTGKDQLAKLIHNESLRCADPFVAINCAAIPETLMESEFFGHERGAYTDAKAQKRGIFEMADKGTLFLDEIGEIPLMLQAKLLRVLEDQRFRRLGGLKDIQLSLRFVAATNRNLRAAVEEGVFRQDLYYRLNVIHIEIPPLRERREDIMPLVRFFIDLYNRKFKRTIDGITPDAEQVLMGHNWPGNVRELRNAIERAMILEDSSRISAKNLPALTASATPLPAAAPQLTSLETQEKVLIEQALERSGGNQSQAARLLSITRDTLRYKLKKHNIHA